MIAGVREPGTWSNSDPPLAGTKAVRNVRYRSAGSGFLRSALLLPAVPALAGAGPTIPDRWHGTPYRTIWQQEEARGWAPYLPVPTDRSETGINSRNVVDGLVDIRRAYPGLIGCSGTGLNFCVFLLKRGNGQLLEIVTTGEQAAELAVWSHAPTGAAAADAEIRGFCVAAPFADDPCPR